MIRLALRVARADAELVLADLLELAPSGVEEIELPANEDREALVEYAVYGAPGELPSLPDLRAGVGGVFVEVSTIEVPDDWSEHWKAFHKPVLVQAPNATTAEPSSAGEDLRGVGEAQRQRFHRGSSLYVRPPWEVQCDDGNAVEIVIDPAQAFGTGSHATTRLCLELLLELAGEDVCAGVLDVGSGSGVLAIAAVKLGYAPVLALDNDRESVRAILANAALNNVEIEARRFDLRHEALPWLDEEGDMDGVPSALHAPANSKRAGPRGARTVVLANLLAPLLLDLADTMPVGATSGGLDLIASGLLCEQADGVSDAFAKRLGLRELARRQLGEWVALWLTSAPLPLAPSP